MPKSTKKNHAKKVISPKPTGWASTIRTPGFGKIYATGAVFILLASTAVWALLSARIQWSNADQTVNALLFEHARTFREAFFPGQHSMLIKWPLFWAVKLFGYSYATFIGFTIATVLLTVSLFAYLLYRIERRPLMFGTLCLALASVLLLVPAQPYSGGILPVNMAMLTTRNLEYIVYIASLALIIRAPRIKSAYFWLGAGCLGLLIASDKLFLTLSVGGALLALIIYAFAKAWNMVTLSVNWLVASVVSGAGAVGVLWLINAAKITHITSQSTAGPYTLVHRAHDIVLGSIYAALGLVTNFGANPSFDSTELRNIPHQAFERLFGPSGFSYVINLAILAFGLFTIWSVVRLSLSLGKNKKTKPFLSLRLSTLLVWSTVVSIGAFIATSHYYAVDARYLTIALFSVFISMAVYIRTKAWKPEQVVLAGVVITLSIALGLFSLTKTYKDQRRALAIINQRNALVAQVLKHHPVSVLVGDYWRVIPAKSVNPSLNVMPLAACTQPRGTLSSQAWQPDLKNHSFAYLLTVNGSLTDYPSCSLKEVVDYYGRPNASSLIAGTLDKPQELLLFYDRGTNKGPYQIPLPAAGPATVLPITADQLPYTTCPGPTIMNVVAHQDDDLLFINPDTLHSVKAGDCVRTVYMTAGDAGTSQLYWLSRERGSEAAYTQMTGASPIWTQRIVKLANNEFITVANPAGNAKISLIFMHLPDGNTKGEGFAASRYESLAALEAGKIGSMYAVDGQSSYTSNQLIAGLVTLLYTYQPTEIRTQNPTNASPRYPDHSDHMAVGRYVQQAYQAYEKLQYDNAVIIPLHFYIGYPIHQMPVNVFGADLAAKEAAWFSYAGFDGSVCHNMAECSANPAYGAYLPRQYQATQ